MPANKHEYTENGTAVATSRLRENFPVHAHQYRTVRIPCCYDHPVYVHSVLSLIIANNRTYRYSRAGMRKQFYFPFFQHQV